MDGKAQVTLSHGESITIQDLPAGYTYVVTEQDPQPGIDVYNGEDYVVSVTQSTIVKGQNTTETDYMATEVETSVYTCTGSIHVDSVEMVAYTNKLEVPIADISFIKVDGLSFSEENPTEITELFGAEFVLYHYNGTEEQWATDSKDPIDLTNVENIWENPITAKSDSDGQVLFEDLQAGHYRLIETSAPDGYQLPEGQWNITLTITGEEGSYVGDIGEPVAVGRPPAFSDLDGIYYLINYKPIDPPITGGDGGEDFRIGGSLLMFTGLVLACWWMWSSPRRRSEFL